MKFSCYVCGNTFNRSPSHINRVKNPTCSRLCRDKLREKPKIKLICTYCNKSFEKYPSLVRDKNNFCCKDHFYLWWTENANGWIDSRGYKVICVSGNDIQEHRYIMEKHIGRSLTENEIVHHINEDILDNRIENLQLMNRSEHTILHNTGKDRKGQYRPPLTEEAKQKISQAKKGKRMSPLTKQKISKSMKKVRKEKFWSTRKTNHETVSESGFENV